MNKILVSLLSLAAFCAAAAGQTNNPPSPATSTVTLTWNPSPSAATMPIVYALWWGTNAGVYMTNSSAGTNLSLTVSNLVRGTTYYFAATASTGAGQGTTSPYSNEASDLVTVQPGAPASCHVIVVIP